MKKVVATSILMSCLMAICFMFAACASPSAVSGSSEAAQDASSSESGEVSSSESGATSVVTDYAQGSLLAFHASMGEDISMIMEISAEACGTCHGEWNSTVAETDALLVDGELSANPHQNHMFKEFACSDCHQLEEQSVLGCNSCHSWEITRDNGTWAA